ncbi:NUDIX hydrolase domain-like protein [Phellopilus nigrolimitatus]|nr:NUDIX hydrolase domain-like protein [Phellopilus nigrolimitatus]
MASFSVSPSVERRAVRLDELRMKPECAGKRLIVGVAVVSQPEGSVSKKILLLKRITKEDEYPDMYELPGGHAENEDATILDDVARELREETGLDVTRVVSEFDEGFEYTTKKGISKQFNFLVEVAGKGEPEVVMNPEEHQAYAWVANEEELENYPMSTEMINTVKHVLAAVSYKE